MTNKSINILKLLNESPKKRKELCSRSHLYFFSWYFRKYCDYKSPDFHKEIFDLTEDISQPLSVITAFRGSGKSTIVNTSFPIWAIIGSPQKKFIILVGKTQEQAREMLKNVRTELETNMDLRRDLGPFTEVNESQWNARSLELVNYGAKIMAISMDQSVRGLRYNQHRPDLIICDDLEDLDSVKTQESRDKVCKWFKGELIPMGNENTRVFVIGNLLHEDSLIKRLESDIEEGVMTGTYRRYPILDNDRNATWPDRYPDKESIESEKKRIGDERTWKREFELIIVPEEDQIIQPEWINYYEELPDTSDGSYCYVGTYIGVDLAVSTASTADYTAMVPVLVYRNVKEKKLYYYVSSAILNKKMKFPDTFRETSTLLDRIGKEKSEVTILFESVGTLKGYADIYKLENYIVEEIHVSTDKRSRLSLAAPKVESGQVRFPKKGNDLLINQLIGFGVEKHDDLVDAFSMTINWVQRKILPSSQMGMASIDSSGKIRIFSAEDNEIKASIEEQQEIQEAYIRYQEAKSQSSRAQ